MKDISLESCILKQGFDMGKCEIMELSEFYRMQVKGDFMVFGVIFSGEVGFQQSLFDTNYWNFNQIEFEDQVNFCNCLFDSDVIMENCTFNGELLFSDAVFNKEIHMHLNVYEGNVSFISNDLHNKVFNDFVYFNVKRKELMGHINFENVNFYNIIQQDRENLHKLERNNKVKIGKGCIKYRVQSPIISIESNSINQNIINELTTSFTNYFINSNGFNLGVEFVNKKINNLELFYFTDENITTDEFLFLLKKSEIDYWDFSVNSNGLMDKKNSIHIIDNYVSKLSVLSKMAFRKQFGLWTDSETEQLLKSISFNENINRVEQINISIDALQFHINTNQMEIKQLNVSHGGQVNIADRIGRIEFNPVVYSQITKDEFHSLKKLLLKLEPSELSDLEKEIKSMQSEEVTPKSLENFKDKVTLFLEKHGLPIVHSLTASGIFEFMRTIPF